jgi:pimeloyl-ACP methyl ester carboxylesterase
MQRIESTDGTTVSYAKYGSGPPLVLVHGGFSDHITNWQECKSLLERRFTVYAIARRGRGETSAAHDRTPAFEPLAMWENEHITRHLRQTRQAAFASAIDAA